MKKIKYIISFFVLFIGLLIIGESYIFFLDNFNTEFESTTMYIQDYESKEMIDDIMESAEKNNINVFTYRRKIPNMFLTEYTIYGTSGVESFINENLGIHSKVYGSMFLGNRQFTFKNFEEIGDMSDVIYFNMIGDSENIHQFKMDLINKYAGNHPREGYSNGWRENNISIWILMGIVILLLSFYDIIQQKKENLVRVSMGESIGTIIIKNIIYDILGYGVALLFAIAILSKLTNIFFGINISLICFTAINIFNAILYINFYFYNLKEVFSNVKISKKVLSFNYVLKLITIIIAIFIISGNIGMISESIKLYKQKNFFKEHADYYFTHLEYGLKTDEIERPNTAAIFYTRYFNDFNPIYLNEHGLLRKYNGFYANKNAFDYLSSKISELKDLSLDKNVYFILPKNKYNESNSDDLITVLDRAVVYEGTRFIDDEKRTFEYTYDVVYYENPVELIKINENHPYGSEFIKNPVIIYCNSEAGEKGDFIARGLMANPARSVMYKLDHEEFDKFVAEFHLENEHSGKTNVLESYKTHWHMAKVALYINTIFSILVLFLEIMLISIILKLEYEVHSIELSLKKILGYNIFRRYGKIVFLTLIITLFSIIAGSILSYVFNMSEMLHLVRGGLVILVLELIITVLYIKKVERAEIQKILKGGNL